MKLKTMTVSDKDTIRKLFRDVFENEPWNDDWSDEKQLDAYLMDLIGQDNSLTLGYWDEEQLTGIAMGHIKHWYTGTEYYIDELCVSRSLQGRGIGSSFLKEIEAYLEEHGIVQIFLQTERTVPAFRFYQNRGFEVLEDHVSLAKQIKKEDR